MLHLENYKEFLEDYKKNTNMIEIESLYEKFSLENSNNRYELQLMSSMKRLLFFNSLDDIEKMSFRRRELEKKIKFREVYSDLEINYENQVLYLTNAIINFLNNTKEDLFEFDPKKEFTFKEFIFVRFCTILKIELIALNKHMKLEHGGHVLFKELVEPLFVELESTEYYEKYNLVNLRDIYRKVQELYDKNPYNSSK